MTTLPTGSPASRSCGRWWTSCSAVPPYWPAPGGLPWRATWLSNLRRPPAGEGRLVYDGPFPDRLLVAFDEEGGR